MNKFFDAALRSAATITGRRSRLLGLVGKLGVKLQSTSWKGLNAAAAKQRIFVFGRMIKAYAIGEYRDIPWRSILLIVAAVIYFVNPLDLVPDIIPITGLTDDFAILVWIYNTLSNEIDKFLLWEKERS